MQLKLSICIFAPSKKLSQYLIEALVTDRYSVNILDSGHDFLNFIGKNKEQIDCLICFNSDRDNALLMELQSQGVLLPLIIIDSPEIKELNNTKTSESSITDNRNLDYTYHNGEIKLKDSQIQELPLFIDRAITQFLSLAPGCALTEKKINIEEPKNDTPTFLMLQQRRLSEKLKERLGYLGIYYKRNSQLFYRNLPEEEQKELLQQLQQEYREIVLNYFSDHELLNQQIDEFVNHAFFADISVSQVLEIHMELIDEFAQQLKLEGRSEEILLDYRLTIIDVIAHLCEMYRRSIPREDSPLNHYSL